MWEPYFFFFFFFFFFFNHLTPHRAYCHGRGTWEPYENIKRTDEEALEVYGAKKTNAKSICSISKNVFSAYLAYPGYSAYKPNKPNKPCHPN